MDSWKKAVFLACLYGFLKEFCPLVPFFTPYLTEQSGVTRDDVFTEIYPVKTYTLFAAHFCTLLVADLLLYKPVIVFGASASIAVWYLLGWGCRLSLLQVSQFASGLCQASEVAFFAYIFAISSTANYRKVAGLSRSAILLGQCLSYSLGQITLSLSSNDVRTLVYVSLGSVVLAFVISVVIPGPRFSPYLHTWVVQRELLAPSGLQRSPENGNPYRFPTPTSIHGNGSSASTCNLISGLDGLYDHRPASANQQFAGLDFPSGYMPSSSHMYSDIDTSSLGYAYSDGNSDISDTSINEERTSPVAKESRLSNCRQVCSASLIIVWKDLSEAYRNKTIVVWSLWLVAALCVDFHVRLYSEKLWDSFGVVDEQSGSYLYSGAAQALAALLGTVLSLVVGFTQVNWHKYEELIVGVVMVISSAVLVVMSHTDVWSAYTFYVVFLAVFQMLSTVAMFQIAGQLTCQRFGLVFGLNSFLSMFVEVIFVLVVVNSSNQAFSVKTQFAVYSGFLGLGGLLFLIRALHSSIHNRYSICCRWRPTHDDPETLVEEQR
ncbi:folate transporter 1-like [Gigantopelta aegis]|uniref:folate transporter 1-like n=1 Tax=Gigantopelta aegis TaxID=1735272 RepID=UPI001B88C434|nr:folate transporter 1-like [Gigantopelta aegis]